MGIKRLLKTMIPGFSLLLTPILFASNGTIGVDSDAENADRACTTGTVFSNPQLDVLENNGGPTQTAAPLPGSPALGIGRNCPATDQRGVARPLNGCTAGAVEGAIAP